MRRIRSASFAALAFAGLLSAPLCAQSAAISANDAAGGIRVRVGVPYVARGPGAIAGSWFTEFKLPDGRYRGFTALGSTLAIDGKDAYSMGGPAVTVLKPGPPGSPSSCGEWIQHVELAGKTLVGWVHNETACNYAKGQTHASMTIATSSDYGLSWKIEGPIISGTNPPAAGKGTGDSCPTVIRGKDEFYYAYCLRNGGQSWNGGYTFLARAPVAQPGPGNWKKFHNGSFSEPGVGGASRGAPCLRYSPLDRREALVRSDDKGECGSKPPTMNLSGE